MSASDIYAGNPYEYEFTVTKRAPTTGATVPATGLTDLVGLISTTQTGAAVHSDLQVALAERSSKPGTYFAVVPTAAINLRLFGTPSYDGQPLFVCCRGADVNVFAKVKARALRPAS
jgi:hypothetical protein